MSMDSVKRYMTRQQGERATAKRSLFAHTRGECSQYELRQHGTSYVGGECGDVAARFATSPIVAQWPAGYRV